MSQSTNAPKLRAHMHLRLPLSRPFHDHACKARPALGGPRPSCHGQLLAEAVDAQSPHQHGVLARQAHGGRTPALLQDRLQMLLRARDEDEGGGLVEVVPSVVALRARHRERLALEPQQLSRQRERGLVERPLVKDRLNQMAHGTCERCTDGHA